MEILQASSHMLPENIFILHQLSTNLRRDLILLEPMDMHNSKMSYKLLLNSTEHSSTVVTCFRERCVIVKSVLIQTIYMAG